MGRLDHDARPSTLHFFTDYDEGQMSASSRFGTTRSSHTARLLVKAST